MQEKKKCIDKGSADLVTFSMVLRSCTIFYAPWSVCRSTKICRIGARVWTDSRTEGCSLYLLPKCLPLNSQQSQETLRMTLTFASHKMHFALILEPWSIEGAEWQGRIFLLRGKQCSSKCSNSLKNLQLECVWRLQASYLLLPAGFK